jgi:hypothetical protein
VASRRNDRPQHDTAHYDLDEHDIQFFASLRTAHRELEARTPEDLHVETVRHLITTPRPHLVDLPAGAFRSVYTRKSAFRCSAGSLTAGLLFSVDGQVAHPAVHVASDAARCGWQRTSLPRVRRLHLPTRCTGSNAVPEGDLTVASVPQSWSVHGIALRVFHSAWMSILPEYGTKPTC